MEGPPGNPFSPDNRGLFTLSSIWFHNPAQDSSSTCRLAKGKEMDRGITREIRKLVDLGKAGNGATGPSGPWKEAVLRDAGGCGAWRRWAPFLISGAVEGMPITTSSDTNTVLVLGVQPTPGSQEGFVSYTFPSAPPNPSGLLQCDSDGTFRWVTPAGIPLGESRHFTGSMTGVCAGSATEVRMTRVTGNRSSVLVSVPADDPTGCYVEATVRAYGQGIAGVTALRAMCGLLYSGGSWSATPTSYLGDHQDSLLELKFAVDTLPGGIGGLYLVVTGATGLRVDADLACYSAPSAG